MGAEGATLDAWPVMLAVCDLPSFYTSCRYPGDGVAQSGPGRVHSTRGCGILDRSARTGADRLDYSVEADTETVAYPSRLAQVEADKPAFSSHRPETSSAAVAVID